MLFLDNATAGMLQAETSPTDLPEFQAPSTGSSDKVQQVIQRLNRLLFIGELVPGQRLVEEDLAADFGLGRGPIREALRILAGDGLIELRPGRGARVRRLAPAEVISILEAMVGLSSIGIELLISRKLERAMLLDLVDAQARIEAVAATGGPFEIQYAMLAFAARVNTLSGNQYLNYLMGRTRFALYCREMIALSSAEVMPQLAKSYKPLVDAILAGDRDAALDAMRHNLVRLRDDMQRSARARGFDV